jgi:acetoin utilization protein AcuB
MTPNPISLNPTSSISEASEIFLKNRIHHIPVVKDGRLVGIVSKSDYLFFKRGFLDENVDEKIEEIRMNNYEVNHIMTKGIASMESSERINVALEIFKENLFHAIPIVDEGKLVGILTTLDIISTLAKDNKAYAAYE